MIAAARRAGLQTGVMFGPLLPFLSDSQASIDALLASGSRVGHRSDLARCEIDPRPRVWPAVAELLLAEVSPVAPYNPYREIFCPPGCCGHFVFLKELRDRIHEAARRMALTDRIAACM